MNGIELLSHAWPWIMALVGLIVQAVRLEARGNDNTRRIAEVERIQHDQRQRLDVELVAIRERLVRIEVLLTTAARDIHDDVRRHP